MNEDTYIPSITKIQYNTIPRACMFW